ncbi:hypothetical protein KEM56_006449 [Ascosphaera pollenicola]|nr:hypothetical protein KEM56_006449 [Ascosphaera pollenicola]
MMFEVCTRYASPWGAVLHMGGAWLGGLLTLAVPGIFLYLAIYYKLQKRESLFTTLTFVSIIGFLLHSYVWVPQCSVIRSELMFVDSICVLKALDLWVRRNRFPQWKYQTKPNDALIALACLFELRYESFTPNFVHTETDQQARTVADDSAAVREKAKRQRRDARREQPLICSFESFKTTGVLFPITLSERMDFLVHAVWFLVLQWLFPQSDSRVLAFQVLLAIYLLWEAWQFILRYRNSPRLFGALYKINSVSNFWSKIWHTAFMSPARSLVYEPIRYGLSRVGVPGTAARVCGFLGVFAFMGIFHTIALMPLFPARCLVKIALFFVFNGVAAILELMVWGRREHWLKAVFAWVFELYLAGWTIEAMQLPQGLQSIEWRNICCVDADW